jgi:hypothetical protein
MKIKMQQSASYKVEEVAESGCSALLFGSARFPSEKLQEVLNRNAALGWTFAFMSIENRPRFLGIARVETAIVIFSRTTQHQAVQQSHGGEPAGDRAPDTLPCPNCGAGLDASAMVRGRNKCGACGREFNAD